MRRKIERTYELNAAEVGKALHWYLLRVKDWPMPSEEKDLQVVLGPAGAVLAFTDEIEEKDDEG